MLFDSYGVMLVFFLTAAAFAVFARVSRRKQGGVPASGGSDAADAEGFRHVLAAVIVIDILFLSAAEYTEEDTFRYAFLIYPLIAAVLWTVLDRFAGREGGWQRGAAAVLAALTVVGSLMPFHDEDVRGLYENHAPVLEALEPYRETATILAFDEYPLSHTIYECIARMDASAPLYIMDPEHHTIDPSDCPDTMVLWISRKHRSAPYTRDLRADGYELEKLGQTNASVIWLCRR